MDMAPLGIEAYQAKREALINDDRSFRRENIWKSQRPAAEIRADECIRNLRAYEASTIWKVESDSIPHPFPGMEFLNGILFSDLPYTICLSKFITRRKEYHRQNQDISDTVQGWSYILLTTML